GYLRTAYTYSPYGKVTAEGDVEQAILWSSEFNDNELGLVYYNYRHYNPMGGRWIGRDLIAEQSHSHLYIYSFNNCVLNTDLHGLMYLKTNGVPKIIVHNSSERRGPGIVATTSKFILKDAPKIGNCKIYYDKTKNKYFITYPSVSYVPVIHFYKINSANAKSIDDPIPDSIYNTYRKHEMVHVEILSRNWNILVDELSLLKEGICSKKEAETAIELAEQIYIIRYYISQLENNDFDWRDYGYNSDNQIKLSIISSNQQAKSNIANAISKISSNSYAQKNGYDYSSLRYELI
ncbi:MAG: RHS repeat-associated core domain-containing protein, partial [Akkermansia sp.]|nr:RHS repeat-associated core domain-containing protein [Akkermansia sp.]